MMISNREVRKLFGIFSELLQLNEKDEAMARHLGGAAYRIGQLTGPVMELPEAELKKQFRSAFVKCILELKEKGTIDQFDELVQLTPPGLFEMMQLKGLGGKKLSVLWKQQGIDSVDALYEACKSGAVASISGFGVKTQQNIVEAIEQYRSRESRFHYASVADEAETLLNLLKDEFTDKKFSLSGEIRRKCNTVAGIEIVSTCSRTDIQKDSLKKYFIINTSAELKSMGNTIGEIPLTIHHVKDHEFASSLFTLTGNEEHVKKILEKSKIKVEIHSEEELYKAAGLQYIIPEMREDGPEWNFNASVDDLIKVEDIKGVVHNHTTYSDGIDTLENFAQACKDKGYEYAVISDHSKNAHYAGGLKEDKVVSQWEAIDALNKKLAPFRVFKSIECDILVSGELDYEDDFLAKFDMVIISVHQLLKMDEEKATRRLIKAIENPHVTILGHMTGRQLLIRPGYPLDFKKVIDACAANGVVIEINANPYRLDVDWSHIPYAMSKGVMISVDPDAHSIAEIDNIRWGVESARKGGLTKKMTWNAMALQDILKWINK